MLTPDNNIKIIETNAHRFGAKKEMAIPVPINIMANAVNASAM